MEILSLLRFHQFEVIIIQGILQLVKDPVFLFHLLQSKLEFLVIATNHDPQIDLTLVSWHYLFNVIITHDKLPIASLADAATQMLAILQLYRFRELSAPLGTCLAHLHGTKVTFLNFFLL